MAYLIGREPYHRHGAKRNGGALRTPPVHPHKLLRRMERSAMPARPGIPPSISNPHPKEA